jgi:hypothetical protein
MAHDVVIIDAQDHFNEFGMRALRYHTPKKALYERRATAARKEQ